LQTHRFFKITEKDRSVQRGLCILQKDP